MYEQPHRAKMEKDMAKADKKAKKERKALEETSAANKAEDLVTLSATSDGDGDGGKSDNDSGTDDGGRRSQKSAKNIAAELAKRPPEEVFQQFDTDGSGLIDFDEFKAMLPQVGIKISLPKVCKPSRGGYITYLVRITAQ